MDPLDPVVVLVKWDLLVLLVFPDLLVPLVLQVVDSTLASLPSLPKRRHLIPTVVVTEPMMLTLCVTVTWRLTPPSSL